MQYVTDKPHWKQTGPKTHRLPVAHGAIHVFQVNGRFYWESTIDVRSIEGSADTLEQAKHDAESAAILSGFQFTET